MAEAIIGGVNYKSNQNTATPYIDIYNQYATQQNAIRDAYKKQLESNKTADESKTNASYDNTAKQNYLNYMQNKKQLPGQLNSLGVNGGATESSLIRLGTNYGNNLATNESGRGSSLSTIGQTYADKNATYDEDFNNKLQQAYLTQLENQHKYEQEQKEKDLQYFANTIHRYNDKASYQKWINAISKTDPNRSAKIGLIMQQMATQFPAGSSSSGGSSGYSSGYSRSYSRGSGSNSASTTPTAPTPPAAKKTGKKTGWLSKLEKAYSAARKRNVFKKQWSK